jgi:hypothetical protein
MSNNSHILPAGAGYEAIFDALDNEGAPFCLHLPVVGWSVTDQAAYPITFGDATPDPESAIALITPAGIICTAGGGNYESMEDYLVVYWNQRRQRDPIARAHDAWCKASAAAEKAEVQFREQANANVGEE